MLRWDMDFVEHVGRLVHPATLFTRRREHFAQRRPKSQASVGHRKRRIARQTAPLEIAQHLHPGKFTLAEPIMNGQQLFATVAYSPLSRFRQSRRPSKIQVVPSFQPA